MFDFLKDTISPLGHLMPFIFGMSIEGDEGGTGDWRATLPPEIKAHPVLEKYQSSEEAVKALVAAQDLIGADKIIMPSKDAKPEEWRERVYSRLGLPKDHTGYALPTDIEIPKDLPVDDKLVEGFKQEAHNLNLLPQQVAGIYKWFMNQQIGAFNTMTQGTTQAKQDAETKLRTDWGAAYGQNLELARKVVNKFATPEVVELLADGLGNDPRVVRMFAEIGKTLSEDQLVGKAKGLILGPEEALAEISKIKGDLKHPYFVANHPEHQAAVDKMTALMKMAYPEKSS